MFRQSRIAYRSLGPVLLLYLVVPSAVASDGEPGQKKQVGQSREIFERHFRSAVAAYEHGEYTTAQREIDLLLPDNPNSFQLSELAGLVQVALGRDQEANAYLAKAVQLSPHVGAARTALAMNLARLNRDPEAETEFRKAVELEPLNHQVNHNLGEFYIRTGRLAEATAYLKRAQEIEPGDYNNGYDLALAYQKTGQLAQARSVLEQLVGIRDNAELHALLGEIHEQAQDYVAAAREYERAARMDPSESNVFDFGAELLLHQTFEPAVVVFRSGLARYPRSARLALGLGVALYGSGHSDDAAREFFRVADANPSDPLPILFLGRVYDSFSPVVEDQARFRLQQAVERFLRNAPIRYFYAMSLWKKRQDQPETVSLDEVESLLKSAIALDPQYSDAYLELGIVYASRQKYPEAIVQYRRALELNPETAVVHFRLGQALVRSGQNAAAKQEFAVFERQRAEQAAGARKQNADIQQFVYTMKNPGSQ